LRAARLATERCASSPSSVEPMGQGRGSSIVRRQGVAGDEHAERLVEDGDVASRVARCCHDPQTEHVVAVDRRFHGRTIECLSARPRSAGGAVKIVGLVYVAFLLLSLAGTRLRNMPLQLVANATGFVLAVLLYRLFAPGDPLIALALLPLAFIHYVIQGVGQVRADAGTLRLALLPFAAYLMVLGYLITRSTFAPASMGVLLVLAGLAWLLAVVPRTPTWATLVVVLFGIIAEVALAIWLLIAPER